MPKSPIVPPVDVRFAAEHLVHAARRLRDRAIAGLTAVMGVPRFDLNIFLESFDEEDLRLARVNWFFPNQEWLTPENREGMGEIDRVLFKTRHAEEELRDLAPQASFVGFTSEDRRDPRVPRDWDRALHVAGWNPLKGTLRLMEVWAGRPSWPRLTAVATCQAPVVASNLDLVSKRLPDAKLRELQNGCGIHVAPSEVEGFGHTLNEALSCGAILITTDAPPMNELAPPRSAILVSYDSEEPMASGTRYRFSEAEMTEAIGRVLEMSVEERTRRSAAAREAYEQRRLDFERRLGEVLEDV